MASPEISFTSRSFALITVTALLAACAAAESTTADVVEGQDAAARDIEQADPQDADSGSTAGDAPSDAPDTTTVTDGSADTDDSAAADGSADAVDAATPDISGDVAPDTDPTDSLCGNGELDPGEECDDGNTESGDGCKSTCTRELSFVCDACTDDAQCGSSGDLCVEGACGADCSTIDCPPGLVCTGFPRGDETVQQCAPAAGCGLDPAGEDCTNEVDDDGDARVDCDDPDCGSDPVCAGDAAGTCASPATAIVGSSNAVPAVNEQSPSCLSIDENEAVFAFTPPTTGTFCLDTRNSAAFDTLVYVRTTCTDEGSELVCYDDITSDGVEFRGYGTITFTDTEPVFVIVDTYSYRTGQSVTLTISSGSCPGAITDPVGGDEPDLGEASCVTDVTDVADDFVPGDSFLIRCPSGCAGRDFVYGTDVYTDDSWICAAAIHAGAITDAAGGQVRVTIAAGQDVYVGSTRNGVTTDDWSTGWPRSFTVEAP